MIIGVIGNEIAKIVVIAAAAALAATVVLACQLTAAAQM